MTSARLSSPLLDEIDRVSAENRVARDPQAIASLLELRHRAFAELDQSRAPEAWPPVLPDPFPDETGAPEVTPAGLDSATLGGAITHHGCILIRQLLSDDRVQMLTDDIDRAFVGFDDFLDHGTEWERSGDFLPFRAAKPKQADMSVMRRFVRNNGGVLTADAPMAMFDLMSCFDDIGMREIVGGYFGEAPAMSLNKCTLRKVPITAHPEWHQDGAFLGRGIRSVNVWIALSDCGGDNTDLPALDIVTRRFDDLVETATDGAYFDISVGHGMVERVAGEGNIVRPAFKRGDALMFDDLFLHRTAMSPGMTRERYAAETWLFAPSRYPDHHVPLAL